MRSRLFANRLSLHQGRRITYFFKRKIGGGRELSKQVVFNFGKCRKTRADLAGENQWMANRPAVAAYYFTRTEIFFGVPDTIRGQAPGRTYLSTEQGPELVRWGWRPSFGLPPPRQQQYVHSQLLILREEKEEVHRVSRHGKGRMGQGHGRMGPW